MANPTNLTDQNAKAVQDALLGKDPFIPSVLPNRMRLYSYYLPGLEAGDYHIDAEQSITTQSIVEGQTVWTQQTKRVYNSDPKDTQKPPAILSQKFEVMAPRFALEREMVNSYYPPDGHQDEGRILPHIVLNDPHFPWERDAGGSAPHMSQAIDPDKEMNSKGEIVEAASKTPRSKVPWVALLVFDPSELKLESQQAEALKIPRFSGDAPDRKDITQAPSSGAFEFQVQEYMKLDVGNRISFEAGVTDEDEKAELKTDTAPMQCIFPTKSTFKQLFPDLDHIEANKYLAHVRAVNTIGFPDAGVEQVGNFSIVVSARTANLNITEPTTQICHFVSIEHIDSTIRGAPYQALADDGRIGMISLFSWTYTALPPNPINFVDSIEHLVEGMQMLRAPEPFLDSLRSKIAHPTTSGTGDTQKAVDEQKAVNNLYKRLSAGYTLCRWRCESGEETAAFNRGPLVPDKVPVPPVADWPGSSNNSKNYQILDRTTGLMDLSYSSAWQLGKTLAIADTAFSSALMRFRTLVYTWAADRARSQKDNVVDTAGLISKLTQDMKVIRNATTGANLPVPNRVVPPNRRDMQPNAVNDPNLRPIIARNLNEAVRTQASTGTEIWKAWSLNKPLNPDWPIISTWISNKLSLCDIPAHFLIPDPSYLPNESLRFFYIDDNWMDCLIDGALSVANHLDPEDDIVRTYLKLVYNEYLASEVVGPAPQFKSSGLKPQIPGYGFILRTEIIKVMPDLRITVNWWKKPGEKDGDDPRAPICRYTKLDDITILALLDRPMEELESIVLAQPPHQQRFSLGYALFPDQDPLKSYTAFRFRKLYTIGAPEAAPMDKPWDLLQGKWQPPHGRHAEWYDWSSRMVQVNRLAADVNAALRNETQAYRDYVPTSAELAMELNDPSYFFSILPRRSAVPTDKTPRNRRLWATETSWPDREPKPSTDTSSSAPMGGSEPAGVPLPSDGKTVPSDSPSKFGGSNGINFTRKPLVIPANPSKPISGTALRSCFSIDVFADYKGYPRKWNGPGQDGRPDADAYVPTMNTYLYDLIFSVRKFRKGMDYTLQEIMINVPSTGAPANIEPLVNADYDDPRARMLSNQRFAIFINNTTTHLQVRIVPRSATMFPSNDQQIPASMSIKDRKSDDLSFRLAEVPIPAVRNKVPLMVHAQPKTRTGGSVQVQMLERYAVPGGLVYNIPGNAGAPCFVIKLDTADAGM